jgi:hypothetical protein
LRSFKYNSSRRVKYCQVIFLAFIQEADLVQQQFLGESEPTMWRLLIAFENFISQWEAMARQPWFSTLEPAIISGTELMTKYYKLSDRSLAAVASSCMYI